MGKIIKIKAKTDKPKRKKSPKHVVEVRAFEFPLELGAQESQKLFSVCKLTGG